MLLNALFTTQALSRTQLAAELVVSVATIDGYREGTEHIPLERQLCLALYAVRYPELARRAHRLRAQALAAMAFEARAGCSLGSVRPQSWKR